MKKDWEIKKLGDCFESITNGANIKQIKGAKGIPITRIETISNDIFNRDRVGYANIIDPEKYKKYILQDNTILMSHINSMKFLGRAVLYKKQNNEIFIHGMNLLNLIPKEHMLLGKFACLYFYTPVFKKSIESISHQSVNQASFNITSLKSLPIPVPPLEEQKRIVKILDEKFAQLESLKANAQTNLQNAKDLLFAELTKTFSNETWSKMTLQEVCTRKITDGTHQTPKYCTKEEGGFPFISSKDVTKEYIDWSNIKYIVPELHEELYKRIAPQKDDVLLAKNGTTGVAAIVEDDRVFDIYVTLAVLRPNQEIINPKYLLVIVNSPLCKKQFDAHLKGSGVPNLHLEEIQKIIIPVPPLNEQKDLINKIEVLKEKIHSLQEIYTKQIANCDELKQSYLQKAFEGEL